MSQSVFLVSAVRTPIGSFGGALRQVPALDLAKKVILEAIGRSGLQKKDIEQIAFGNCLPPLDQNIARIAALLAGLPNETPGYTINCACSSAMQALFGANQTGY